MTPIEFSVALDLYNQATRRVIGVTEIGQVVEEMTALGGAATAAGAVLCLHPGRALTVEPAAFYAKHQAVAAFLRDWAQALGEPDRHDMRTLFDQACRVPVGLGGYVVTPLGGVAAYHRVPLSLSLVRWQDVEGMPCPPEIVRVQRFMGAWADALESRVKAAEPAPKAARKPRGKRAVQVALLAK